MKEEQRRDLKSAEDQRFLIAIGTGIYDHLPKAAQRPEVQQSIIQIVECFQSSLRYHQRELLEVSYSPSKDALLDGLDNWFKNNVRSSADIVVFYYCGHGVSRKDGHYLLTRDSNLKRLARTAIRTEDLGRLILEEDSRAGQVLLILDTCYSGSGAFQLAGVIAELSASASEESSTPSDFYVLASTGPKQEAKPEALSTTLSTILRNESGQYGGSTVRFLKPDEIVGAVQRKLKESFPNQRLRRVAIGISEEWRIFPNPQFDECASDGEDLETERRLKNYREHWIPRARGTDMVSAAWYFTGRKRVLRKIVGWLSGAMPRRQAWVVTGSPGAGKSAILSRLITLSDPETREQIERKGLLAGIATDTIPAPGLITMAIYAHGTTLLDVVQSIATSLRIIADSPEALISALASRTEKTVIIVDALDEAQAPQEIAEKLLSHLTTLPQVWLLVGTRPDSTPDDQGRKVRSLGEAVHILDLDDVERYPVREDIEAYVYHRLLALGEPQVDTPYRNRQDLVPTVAGAVAEKAKGIFLVARIVCRSLIERSEPIAIDMPGWKKALPGDVGTAFERDLDRFEEDRYQKLGLNKADVKALLRPLAFAEGTGLPWDYLWVPLANAIVGRERAYDDDDIALLHTHAGAYIVRSTEGGGSVYRLYHQELAKYLRAERPEQEVQRRITETLINLTPDFDDSDGKDWSRAHQYTQQHLATHAARADTVDRQVGDSGFVARLIFKERFLVYSGPYAMRTALARVGQGLRKVRDIYNLAMPDVVNQPLDVRALAILLATMRQGEAQLAQELSRGFPALQLVPEWVQTDAEIVPLHYRRSLTAYRVQFGRLGEERALAFFEDTFPSINGAFRVWLPDKDQMLQCAGLDGHAHGAPPLYVGNIDGYPAFACSSGMGLVVANANTGKAIHSTWSPACSTLLLYQGHGYVVESDRSGQVWVRPLGSPSMWSWERGSGDTSHIVETSAIKDYEPVAKLDGLPKLLYVFETPTGPAIAIRAVTGAVWILLPFERPARILRPGLVGATSCEFPFASALIGQNAILAVILSAPQRHVALVEVTSDAQLGTITYQPCGRLLPDGPSISEIRLLGQTTGSLRLVLRIRQDLAIWSVPDQQFEVVANLDQLRSMDTDSGSPECVIATGSGNGVRLYELETLKQWSVSERGPVARLASGTVGMRSLTAWLALIGNKKSVLWIVDNVTGEPIDRTELWGDIPGLFALVEVEQQPFVLLETERDFMAYLYPISKGENRIEFNPWQDEWPIDLSRVHLIALGQEQRLTDPDNRSAGFDRLITKILPMSQAPGLWYIVAIDNALHSLFAIYIVHDTRYLLFLRSDRGFEDFHMVPEPEVLRSKVIQGREIWWRNLIVTTYNGETFAAATTGRPRMLVLFRPALEPEPAWCRVVAELSGYSAYIAFGQAHGQLLLALGEEPGVVRIFPLTDGPVRHELRIPITATAVAFSQDNRLLIGTSRGPICLRIEGGTR